MAGVLREGAAGSFGCLPRPLSGRNGRYPVYPLKKLVEKAKNHHYSTFKFYGKKEFSEALHKFRENILRHYEDPDKISWKDENTLLVIENIHK